MGCTLPIFFSSLVYSRALTPSSGFSITWFTYKLQFKLVISSPAACRMRAAGALRPEDKATEEYIDILKEHARIGITPFFSLASE